MRRLVFTSSIKRQFRDFCVVVVYYRGKKADKKVCCTRKVFVLLIKPIAWDRYIDVQCILLYAFQWIIVHLVTSKMQVIQK